MADSFLQNKKYTFSKRKRCPRKSLMQKLGLKHIGGVLPEPRYFNGAVSWVLTKCGRKREIRDHLLERVYEPQKSKLTRRETNLEDILEAW